MIALPAVTTLLGAASSASSSSSRNRALKRAAQDVERNRAAEDAVAKIGTADQISKVARALAKFQGLSRVSSAERGVSSSRSSGAIEISADAAAGQDVSNINTNSEIDRLSRASQARAQISSLESETTSPFTSGILGGLQGLQMGLQATDAFGYNVDGTKKQT